jgi:uncharacterized membrane protein
MADYLKETASYLRSVPDEDRAELLRYYEEYFSDAGFDQETLVSKYGTPKQFSRTLLAEYLLDNDEAAEKMTEEKIGQAAQRRNSTRLVWIVVLALFASPILLPVAIAIVIGLVAIAMAILILLVAGFATLIFLVLGGLYTFVAGLAVLSSSLATGLFFTGVGLVMTGIGVFLFPVAVRVVWVLVDGFMNLVKFIGRKVVRRTKRQQEVA